MLIYCLTIFWYSDYFFTQRRNAAKILGCVLAPWRDLFFRHKIPGNFAKIPEFGSLKVFNSSLSVFNP